MKIRRLSLSLGSLGLGLAAAALFISIAAAATQIDILGPDGSEEFGSVVHVLPNGNLLIGDPGYNAGGVPDVGAMYLYDGDSGALISRLTGSTTGDLENSSFTVLANGNFLVRSPFWDHGAALDAGAATWGSGISGVTGTISAANSLVGSTAGDVVGNYITELTNGNYVVNSPDWDHGSVMDAGAVTWGDGTKGVTGTISAANSLVGSSMNDGFTIERDTIVVHAFANGNYVVGSPGWDNGAAVDAGAATWVDGTKGITGTISADNSLVGSTMGDQVGRSIGALTNGNYVVSSTKWDNGTAADAGAVTWGDGTTGVTGEINAANSLVGSMSGDWVGGVMPLRNGNYLVNSSSWHENRGAVTWGDGAKGVSGVVSADNSLVGTTIGDWVGGTIGGYPPFLPWRTGVIELANSNYVVLSSLWDNGSVEDAGAVTWGDGAHGTTGVISADNSLVGSKMGDAVGQYVLALENGNYLVQSLFWDNGTKEDTGAVTWGDGMKGVSGVVSAANSLLDANSGDQYPSVVLLPNGNFVVKSPYWDHGSVLDAGAITWGDGMKGVTGAVSVTNSLVGSASNDMEGIYIHALANGNFLVRSPYWDHGAALDAGAVTWGNGAQGVTGAISTANSLVGSASGDRVGESWPALLANGNYVVGSPSWDNGAIADAGAATWGDGTKGVTGTISAANSLVGSRNDDRVGGVLALANGNYVVSSPFWDNGAAVNAGAITWGDGLKGVSGAISPANSLVGGTTEDWIGEVGWPQEIDWINDVSRVEVVALANGNYLVSSPYWDSGAVMDAGAVTWGDGTKGVTGTISTANSLTGSSVGDRVGAFDYDNRIVTELPNGNYVVKSPFWDNGLLADAGAVTWGDGYWGTISGTITLENSVLGSSEGKGNAMKYEFDRINQQLVIGRPGDNIVTLFRPGPARNWAYHVHLPLVARLGDR